MRAGAAGLLAVLAACGSDPDDAGSLRGRRGTNGTNGPDDTADSGEAPADAFVLAADATVALPYVEAGQSAPSAALHVRNDGGQAATEGLMWIAEAPFVVEGDDTPLAPGEERTLTVRFDGSTATPALYAGAVRLWADGQEREVRVGAAVGDPDLPAVVDWEAASGGSEATVSLPSAPFPWGGARYDDDSVLIFVPESLTDRAGVGVVTHLHGHYATLATTVPRQKIVEQHALSGRDAVLVVPQGPENAADSDFGRLDEADGFADLTRDVLTLLFRDGFVSVPETGQVALTAHSGGYSGTANILEQGGVPIDAVHLFDALYAREDTYAAWADGGGVLRSSYTSEGGTTDENVAFADDLADAGLRVGSSFDDDALDAVAVTVGYVPSSHDGCLAWERNYARWLAASGLSVRPAAPPSLRAVLSDGETATVTWRADPGGERLRYVVQGSADGASWSTLATTEGTSASVPATAWVRLVREDDDWGDSDPSDTYGGTGADWLIVDGFDRVLDGSWHEASHPFAAWVGNALGAPFSVAANEAVEAGDVDLGAYAGVIWLLGDEGTADLTFSAAEQDAIDAYLDGGGRLIVSGAEVGYATDADWLSDTLHAAYVADDAGTDVVAGLELGAAYPEDYPDVLAGERTLLRYATGDAAAVAWSDRVVVVGFGLENLPTSGLGGVLDTLRDAIE